MESGGFFDFSAERLKKVAQRPWGFGALLFAVLTAVNLFVLSNPPYWDDIMGLHAQAVALARNGFDVAAVARSGGFWAGGAEVYRWGVLHYPLAVLYRWCEPGTVHVLWRLFNIGCLAAAGALAYALMLDYGVKRSTAAVCVLAGVAMPLSFGLSASLGMEPAAALAGMIAVRLIARESFGRGLFAVAAGSLVKLTMVTTALALALYCGLRACRDFRREWRRLAVAAAVAALLVALVLCESDGAEQSLFSLGVLWNKILFHGTYLLGPLLPLTALLGGLWLAALIGGKKRRVGELFLLLNVLGFWGGYFLSAVPLPRYALFAVFPLLAALAIRADGLLGEKHAKAAAWIVFACCALWNAPFCERALPPCWAHSGEYLERSRRGFLADLERNRTLCRELENQFADLPVVVKWPYLQMLAIPEMGYVKQPLRRLYSGGRPIRYAGYAGNREDVEKLPGAFYLYVPNSFEYFSAFGPPMNPRAGDRIARVWGRSCLYLHRHMLQKR